MQETTFFEANGVVLVLWSREKLAADCGVADAGAGFDGIALAHNVGSREEVHEVIERARSHGAEISREPAETFYGGYAGVFRDPDGHCWEVAHNPGFGLAADGSVILPARLALALAKEVALGRDHELDGAARRPRPARPRTITTGSPSALPRRTRSAAAAISSATAIWVERSGDAGAVEAAAQVAERREPGDADRDVGRAACGRAGRTSR